MEKFKGQTPKKKFEIRQYPTSREEILQNDPLRDYHVWWNDGVDTERNGLCDLLDANPDEHAVQRFLNQNPILLAKHLGRGWAWKMGYSSAKIWFRVYCRFRGWRETLLRV